MVNRSAGRGPIAGIAGLALGVASMAVASVYPSSTVVIALLAIVGMVLMLWSFGRDLDAFRAFSKKHSTHVRLNNALMVVFFVFIIVLLNLIARQYYLRLDYSTEGRFTLAPQSEAVARAVDSPLTVWYFGVEGSRESERMRELLETYRYLNRNIVYELKDLDRSPVLAGRYGVKQYDTIVVESENGISTQRGLNEEAVTNLLIRATRDRQVKVRYLVGHGERDLEGTGRDGYGLLTAKMRSMGYLIEPLALMGAGHLPPDTDVLLVAAPAAAYSTEEMKMLEAYRASGGKFIVLAEGPGPLDGFIGTLGLAQGQYPVYDQQNVAGTDPSSPLVTRYINTPITEGFGLSTIFPGVHELKPVSRHTGLSHMPFVQTSMNSWYDSNHNGMMDAGEDAGFNDIAVIVSSQTELMKAVVYGDSDFVSNAYYTVEGNINLMLNSLAWLTGEGALTSVAAKSRTVVPMYITDRQARLIRLLVAWGIPLLILVSGLAVWLRRRAL